MGLVQSSHRTLQAPCRIFGVTQMEVCKHLASSPVYTFDSLN